MEPTDPMRANVEVLAVIVEAASQECVSALTSLELSSTANSGNFSTLSIPSPNLSDQSLPIEASLHAQALPPGNTSARAPPQYLPKAQAMRTLQESIPHAMTLQKLKKSEKGHQRDATRYKKRMRRVSKEIYMIVSTYALLQGVLFVAVAQSNAFTCEEWRGVAGIVGMVAIGTLYMVVDKLCQNMGRQKALAKRSERCQSAVYDKIDLLYSCGSGCPIDHNLEPQRISRDLPACHALLCPRGLLVLGFLVGFSLLMIKSCTSMLCHSLSH